MSAAFSAIMIVSFEYALDYLIDHELDRSELKVRYRNNVTDASAYDPSVPLILRCWPLQPPADLELQH